MGVVPQIHSHGRCGLGCRCFAARYRNLAAAVGTNSQETPCPCTPLAPTRRPGAALKLCEGRHNRSRRSDSATLRPIWKGQPPGPPPLATVRLYATWTYTASGAIPRRGPGFTPPRTMRPKIPHLSGCCEVGGPPKPTPLSNSAQACTRPYGSTSHPRVIKCPNC